MSANRAVFPSFDEATLVIRSATRSQLNLHVCFQVKWKKCKINLIHYARVHSVSYLYYWCHYLPWF